jgi:translocation and assembly module TamA
MPKRWPPRLRFVFASASLLSIVAAAGSDSFLAREAAAQLDPGEAQKDPGSPFGAEQQTPPPMPERPSVEYEVTLEGAPNAEAEDLLKKSLSLYRYQENGAPSVAMLRARARSDQEVAQRILRSLGYYEASASSEVTREKSPSSGPSPAQPSSRPAESPTTAQPPAAARQASVVFRVVPGRVFTLAFHQFAVSYDPSSPAPVLPSAQELGSPVGTAARARDILDAEGNAVVTLRQTGYPYAEQGNRDAVMDPAAATLEVWTGFNAGKQVHFGELRFEGIPDIDEEYLRSYIPWSEGDLVDVRQLGEYQRRLIETGLFSAGSINLPEDPPAGETADVVASMEQRPFRTFGAGAKYSTDIGPSVEFEFEHRNLFGSNETIKSIAILGLEEQSLNTRFRKPQYLRDGQDIVSSLSLRNLNNDAFEETGGTFTLGLERQINDNLLVGIGGLAEITYSKSATSDGTAYLLGMPGYADYNSTDDTLNPTKGWHAYGNVTPFVGTYQEEFLPFISLEGTASTYWALDDDRRYILAVRGRLGSILAEDVDQVPPGRRFYSGGGGSVRGYDERSIGPLAANGDPTGGLSVVEAEAEFRFRIYDDFGAALFTAAGSVSEDPAPTFSDGVQYSAGGGLRYYSPVGPIRVDLGVPLNARRSDDSFVLYFAIGQAF